MKPLSVFEYGRIEPLSGIETSLLDQLRGPRNERMFDVGWRETRATSFVGVVQLPQTTLQILPKMYRRVLDGRDEPPARPSEDHAAGDPAGRPYLPNQKEREATANLLYLLSYTRKLEVTEPEIRRLTAQRAPFSEILFWVFAQRLWEAVHREVLRGYVTIEDRLAVLKGRWLIAAQAGRPDGWRRDRFDVVFDEFTEDNLPNRLFKATIHRLSQWAHWSDTRRRLTQLRAVFADVADVIPQPHDFDQAAQWVLRHRRRANEGHLYRPLLKLAQMFWTGTGPQPSPGRTETFAFLFDMNQLFEEFIAEFIRRELSEVCQCKIRSILLTLNSALDDFFDELRNRLAGSVSVFPESVVLRNFVAMPEQVYATDGAHGDVRIVFRVSPVTGKTDLTLLEVLPVLAVFAGP